MRTIGLAALLAVAAIGCGSDDSSSGSAGGGPPDEPVKIRMGWGIPGEEIKYVMMERPEVARNLGTWYEVEWQQFSGTALGVQGLAAGTLDCATVGGLSVSSACPDRATGGAGTSSGPAPRRCASSRFGSSMAVRDRTYESRH